MSEERKVSNEIRVGLRTKPKDVISQCPKLINEEKVKELHLSAVGNTIGNLVVAVEIDRSIFPDFPDFYQSIEFSTIPARVNGKDKDKKPDTKPQKLYPRQEIILSSEKKEGSKFTVTEEEEKILIDTLEKQKEAFTKIRKFRRNFRNARRRVFSGRRKKLSFSTKNSGFNNRRKTGYNKRPFVKSPTGKRNNIRKFNTPKNNNVAKEIPIKN